MTTPRHPLQARCAALAFGLTLVLTGERALALSAVFQGDPVNASTGKPWIVLPGLPLVDWGRDEKWRTRDDVINSSIVGDVDVVVRAGGTYVPGSGVIPAPASSVATAPQVAVGGLTLAPAGNEVAYQIVLSDGAASPAAGHPLVTHDLDDRGTVVVAFPDLDGDGVIGPNAADGAVDDRIEEQETQQLAGRRLAVLQNGVASGTLAVSLGAPASSGGLGLLLAAGAITGDDPPLYDDAGWIATRLPLMWPIDPQRIIGGGNAQPPAAGALVDLEIEPERTFLPATSDALLGSAFKIPLDGSSVTNDVVRALSGTAETVAFVRAVDASTFSANPLRVLRPVDAPVGGRVVVETADATSVRDDGPGRVATVLLHPADRLGNDADPPPGGLDATVEASAGLRIAAPDTDADPTRETLHFASGRAVAVLIDDDGRERDDAAAGTVLATVAGAPSAALRVTIERPGPGAPAALAVASARLGRSTGRGQLTVTAEVTTPPGTDLAKTDLTVALRSGGAVLYQRTIPAGALLARSSGRRFLYRETAAVAERITSLVLRRDAANPARFHLRMKAKGLDLGRVPASLADAQLSVVVGDERFRALLTCAEGAQASDTVCAP
jgi:hypothetical protein